MRRSCGRSEPRRLLAHPPAPLLRVSSAASAASACALFLARPHARAAIDGCNSSAHALRRSSAFNVPRSCLPPNQPFSLPWQVFGLRDLCQALCRAAWEAATAGGGIGRSDSAKGVARKVRSAASACLCSLARSLALSQAIMNFE